MPTRSRSLIPSATFLALASCGTSPPDPPSPALQDYRVPLAADSPWPKFRRTPTQDGRSPLPPVAGGPSWSFPTGRGIFSSPVVGGDGTVYVGSADRTFYALRADGSVRWTFPTGEIIDSSALLDARGRVVFGSGDGNVYALDAATGAPEWTFQADDPADTGAFIRWFEGNVAMGPDGTLYAPNDNFRIYALDGGTGTARWAFPTPDQTWSSPAVDPLTGDLYLGNNNLLPLLGNNVFALDSTGAQRWADATVGSVAASPVLTADGRVVVGGFDGFVRAWSREGDVLWETPLRDHVYASPAEAADGTLIQPCADGTVYALDPATGAVRWAFDTLEPLRSSPAIGGDGRIYLGSGAGRLLVLTPEGALDWSMLLVSGDRNDLNASPALGPRAIYLAGESGEIFSVAYHHCREHPDDARCTLGPGEGLPDDGARFLPLSAFGTPVLTDTIELDAGAPLALGLLVRRGADTALALIDGPGVVVTPDPPQALDVVVSGDRRFFTVAPQAPWLTAPGGEVRLRVQSPVLEDFVRRGLRLSGGTPTDAVDQVFTLRVLPGGAATLPLPTPSAVGEPAAVWEFARLAAPLPTILPSYNQIGFDSLRYLVGLATPDIAWMVGAQVDPASGATVPDPATKVLFPLVVRHDAGSLVLRNQGGFVLEVFGVSLGFSDFRISARLDAAGDADGPARLVVGAVCGQIPFYGPFLQQLGFCNPDTDVMQVYGAAELRRWGDGRLTPPTPAASVTFDASAGAVVARVAGSGLDARGHRLGLLLVDPSSGAPVALDYGPSTVVTADASGQATEVRLETGAEPLPSPLRVILMVDTAATAEGTVTPAP